MGEEAKKCEHGHSVYRSDPCYGCRIADLTAQLAELKKANQAANQLIAEAADEAEKRQQQLTALRAEKSDVARLLRQQAREAGALAAEVTALRGALERQKRHCYFHAGGDDGCSCDEIDAALAPPAPQEEG